MGRWLADLFRTVCGNNQKRAELTVGDLRRMWRTDSGKNEGDTMRGDFSGNSLESLVSILEEFHILVKHPKERDVVLVPNLFDKEQTVKDSTEAEDTINRFDSR